VTIYKANKRGGGVLIKTLRSALLVISILIMVLIGLTACNEHDESYYSSASGIESFSQALETGMFTVSDAEVENIFYHAPEHHEDAISEIINLYYTYSERSNFELWLGITAEYELAAIARFGRGVSPQEIRLVNLEFHTDTDENGVSITQIKDSSGVIIASGF